MSKCTVTDETVAGGRQCHICGKYISTDRPSQLNRAMAGHLIAHYRKGEAIRKAVWRNGNKRSNGKTVIIYEKVTTDE